MELEQDIFLFFMGTIRNKNGDAYSRGIRIELEEVSDMASHISTVRAGVQAGESRTRHLWA